MSAGAAKCCSTQAWNVVPRRACTDGADGTGRCRRTDDDAHVRLDVSDLAATYLGNRSIAGQAAAGYVTEVRPGAVAELSRAMRTDTAPYGALMF